jgi:hypothetical protein
MPRASNPFLKSGSFAGNLFQRKHRREAPPSESPPRDPAQGGCQGNLRKRTSSEGAFAPPAPPKQKLQSLEYCCHSCMGPPVAHRPWMGLLQGKLRRDSPPRAAFAREHPPGEPSQWAHLQRGLDKRAIRKGTLAREPPPREPSQGNLPKETSSRGTCARKPSP